MDKTEKDVLDAAAALAESVVAARAAGYRVSFQSSGGDPTVVVDGGPEPAAVVAEVEKSVPATFGTRKPAPESSNI